MRKQRVLTGTKSDPWALYLYSIKSPATKEKYLIRLRKFLDFIDQEPAALETKARAFAERGKHTDGWAFNSILEFMQFQKERFNRKEITAGRIRNYVKSIKLFCQMADIHILWDKIPRGLPRGRRYADDRAPTLEEIKKLCQYQDRRIKPLAYTMESSGIRVGAWTICVGGTFSRLSWDSFVTSQQQQFPYKQ